MNRYRFLLMVLIVAALSLTACERSANPVGDPTPTLDDIASIYSMRGTLTAQAPGGGLETPDGVSTQSGDSPLFGPTPTSTFAVVTATPTQLNTPAPTLPQSVPGTYTLEDGEYPYCIARRFDVDIIALLASSGLTEEDLYGIGTVLTIPSAAAPFQGERTLLPHPTQYTVLAGETIYAIACKFGDVFPESIAQANGLDINEDLTPGQVIQIP